MADLSVELAVPDSDIKECASLRLFQSGEVMVDGVCYAIGPVICQAFLDADGNWVRGCYHALDPEQAFSMAGVSRDEVVRLVGYWLRMAKLSAGD